MKFSNSKLIRRVFQLLFFLYLIFIVIIKYLKERGVELPLNSENLHSICPFGAVETLGRLLFSGKFIPQIHESNFWTLFGILLSTTIFGALFCGWLCPLGFVQDLFGKIGKKLFKQRYNSIPLRVDRILGYTRFLLLGIILFQTTWHLSLVFTSVDPYYALLKFWTGEALTSAILVLIVVLLSSLFVARPWCRWFCPLSGVLGFFQFLSPWKIRRNNKSCIGCGKCTTECQMNIEVDRVKNVTNTRCNRCGDCLLSCPVKETLTYSLPGNKIHLNMKPLFTGVIVVLLFITPVVIAKKTGLFITSHKTAIDKGNLKAEEIKGSLTISELAIGFSTTPEELISFLDLPENTDMDIKLRSIEDISEKLTLPEIRKKMELWK